FGKARCAIEAMACGTAVILCDYRGLGPLVTSAGLGVLRGQNFGMRALTAEITSEAVRDRVAAYDAADAAEVGRRIRSEAGLDAAISEWIEMYGRVIADARSTAGATD